MSRAKKALLLLAPAGTLALLVFWGLRREGPPQEPPPPYSFSSGELVLKEGSKLLSRLEIVEVGAAAAESAQYRSVGQIIALSNNSGSLTGERVRWVELDAALTAASDLRLDGGLPPGTAYGLTTLPAEYSRRVSPGESVSIIRYGLKGAGTPATIVKVLPRAEGGDHADVVFRFGSAQDWFPGTNCEVSFPSLQGRPVRVPTTAPVHEGAQEYVWTETARGASRRGAWAWSARRRSRSPCSASSPASAWSRAGPSSSSPC